MGDFWRYRGEEQWWDAIEVVDTTLIGGEKYYVREHPVPYVYYDTLSCDTSGQVRQVVNKRERTLYKFNISIGDTWSYNYITPYDTQRVIIKLVAKLDGFQMVGPLGGTYHDVLVFFADIPGAYDVWRYDYLAPGLGLIFSQWQMDRRTLYGAVIGGKLYGDTSAKVVKVVEDAVSRNFKLLQNYPNPFNSATMIGYELAEPALVDLSIYDVLGRKVKRLVWGFKSSGTHEAKLEGGELPTGIYFYRLVAGNTTFTRKLVYLR